MRAMMVREIKTEAKRSTMIVRETDKEMEYK